MKLRYSTTSPFARKALVVAHETGLADQVECVVTNAWAPDTDLVRDNPLSKIPALITEGGETLYDSPVICEYLDSLHNGRKLFPAAGGERWTQLRLQALADGIMDAAVQVRIETAVRPEGFRWTGWVERQVAAIERALDVLEQECAGWGGDFLIGQVTAAVALAYLDLRKPVPDWRTNRPALTGWSNQAAARQSMIATEYKV